MFVRLARFDLDTQEDTPSLASTWDASADGRAITFHLRRGAFFSDGHPITAEDVVFSVTAIYDERITAARRDTVTVNGKPLTLVARDSLTVDVRSPVPHGSLAAMLGDVYIVPKHVFQPMLEARTLNSAYGVGTPPDQLVTSGPFTLKAYLPNDRTVLTRNPYWFGVDKENKRLPYLDELIFLVAPDQDAADLKFRSGEVDALPLAKPANYPWYAEHEREGRFTLHDLGPELGPNFLFFNQHPPHERCGAAGHSEVSLAPQCHVPPRRVDGD